MSHTPGPWHVEYRTLQGSDTLLLEIRSEFGGIAQVYGANNPDDETDPNAKLIAAAPELLDALYAVKGLLYDMADEAGDVALWNEGGDGYETAQLVRTALAKAEGRETQS